MDKIISPIKDELNIFEGNLKKVILSANNFLSGSLESFMFSNPKRLRPVFVFLFSGVLNIKDSFVQKIALISELIHSASLIHDDIIDEEKIRRNNPTFYEKYGAKLAVLEGDFLLALALENISQTTLEISQIFAKKIKETINGEINQNENLNCVTSIETYLKKTKEKTANLFFAGLEALFCLGSFEDEIKNILCSFLENYCLAFQIKNDIDNFKKDSTDIKNGNYTLPVIYFFMENGASVCDFQNVDFGKFLEKSYQKVQEFEEIALENLNKLENSIYKNSLIELTKYSLRR